MYNGDMLDKTLEYVQILMIRRRGKPVRYFPVPEGFSISMYKKGDEVSWAEIEASVGEFESVGKAHEYFCGKYLPYERELERRCIFIEDGLGKKVATFTAWWEYAGKRRKPWVSWVSVRPEYQGIGLGKAIVSAGIKLFIEIEGDADIYLKTQTWSYKAVNIYREQGFRMKGKKHEEFFGRLDVKKARKVMKGYIR